MEGLFLGFFGICAPICLNVRNDVLFTEKCIRLVREKLTIFPYGQDIVGNEETSFYWLSDDIVRFKIEAIFSFIQIKSELILA